MTETTYIYTKGVGWTVSPINEVLSRDGKKRLVIEQRVPEPGESYILACANWTITDVCEHASRFEWRNYLKWSEHETYEERMFAVRFYCTACGRDDRDHIAGNCQ